MSATMALRLRERGSSLPETAIVMAVLLVLMFGIIDFGRAIYTYGFVADLARQGSRWAVVRGSQSCTNSANRLDSCNFLSNGPGNPVEVYVQSLSEGATVASNIHATPQWSCPSSNPTGALNAPGCVVQVTVTYRFNFVLPLLPRGTLPMSSTSQMVISQ